MPLSVGDKLGHYEVLSLLGQGGMGEVYRARDTTLKRDVALKVLPATFLRDHDRMARFQREAEVLASLDHPNIGHIYGFVDSADSRGLVLALIEGPTLADRIEAGPIPLDETVAISKQIVDALEYAHDRGVVHRDLKPANIKITPEGVVKVLDFGLAKVLEDEPPPSPLSNSPTLTVGHTRAGMILGTAAYMSPEQAVGRPVDRRSDIFSFGAVLYEMLTAKRAFTGATTPDVLESLVKNDPDWAALPAGTPGYLRNLLRRTLVKDRKQRLQAIAEARIALENPGVSGVDAGATSTSRLSKLWPIGAAALVLVAVGVAGGRVLWNTPAAPEWSGEILGGPEAALDPRPSPDGSLLAFQAFDRGNTQVAVMKPESGNWSMLTHSRERGYITVLAWSADGASIYYDRLADVPQGVYSVPLLGGDEHLVLENAGTPQPLPDGSLLVTRLNAKRQTQLFRFWPDTGRLQDFPVLSGAGFGRILLRIDPTGKLAVLFGNVIGRESEPPGLVVVDLGAGAARPLTSWPTTRGDSLRAFAFSHDGQSVITAARADSLTRIVSIPLNGRTPPQTLFTVTNQVWFLDPAADESIYLSLTDRPVELVRRSLSGDQAEHIASFPTQVNDTIAVLPDGRAAVTARTGGHTRLVLVEKGKDPIPLTSAAEETSGPMTIAGPREIAFLIGPVPHQTIALADTASNRVVRRIPLNKGNITSLASSPDGKTLYAAAGGSIWAVPSSGGEARMIRAGDSVAADPSGRQLVISVTESAKFRLFRVPVEGGPEQEIVTDGSIPLMGGPSLSPNALSADGRLLQPLESLDSWFNAPALLDTATGRITRIVSDDVSDYKSMAWLPDGRILALHVGLRSTLWKFQPRK